MQAPMPERPKFFFQTAAKVRDMGTGNDQMFHIEGRNNSQCDILFEYGVLGGGSYTLVTRKVPTATVEPEWWSHFDKWKADDDAYRAAQEERIQNANFVPYSRNPVAVE